MPLTDSAPLLLADELGCFTRRGLRVALSLATSWAGLRDRVMVASLDGAQMLAPMPIAAALGLGGVRADFSVTASTSRNGNTLTLGGELADELAEYPVPLAPCDLAAVLRARRARGLRAPVLAVVFAFSSHNYLLRHWLAAGGIDPDRDVQLMVVPPSSMAEHLASGAIDGFCAGEPWGSRAVDLRVGRIVLETADICADHPEKVLAFGAAAMAAGAEPIVAATAAVIEATQWLADPANSRDAARVLRERALADVPLDIIERALATQLVRAPDEPPVPFAPMTLSVAATAPDPEQGAWWFAQMQRWHHVSGEQASPVRALWRTELWRAAAAGIVASIADPVVA